MFLRLAGYLIEAMESLVVGFAPAKWFVLLRAITGRRLGCDNTRLGAWVQPKRAL